MAAEVAFMFNEWYKPNSCLDFPIGGSQAMADALARGVTKREGGKVYVNSHVEGLLMDGDRVAGVQLRGGGTIRATKAVVSNASVWDTVKLLPQEHVPEKVCLGDCSCHKPGKAGFVDAAL